MGLLVGAADQGPLTQARARRSTASNRSFPYPSGILGLRSLLEGLDFGLDGGGPFACSCSAFSNAACALSSAC